VLTLPADLAPLENERLQNRLRQLARLIGREPVVVASPPEERGAARELSWSGTA
jgi:exopolyphosphatase/guanosine-5'-triphosphate,3'-diphosphate pyrophosphatase